MTAPGASRLMLYSISRKAHLIFEATAVLMRFPGDLWGRRPENERLLCFCGRREVETPTLAGLIAMFPMQQSGKQSLELLGRFVSSSPLS